MKFMMDERVKHRLTGIVVILSIAAVFIPAMMKKSNQHFEENIGVSMKLPSKPMPPNVSIPKQNAMLKTVKVAHVDIQNMPEEPYKSIIAKAEPLSTPPAPVLVKAVLPVKAVKPALTTPTLAANIVSATTKKINSLKEGYGVQLASFGQQRNAEYLVARLRKQGFDATYNKINGKKGMFYQVVVGLVNQKNDAVSLQKKLANNMQLNGFVIKAGVS